MVLTDNSSFILLLEKFAVAARNNSSFTVTFKKFDGYNKPKPRPGKESLPEPKEYSCLIRANMKSKKVSTVVKQEDVSKMMQMYGHFMKSNMDGLKKIKKGKAKSKAAKG